MEYTEHVLERYAERIQDKKGKNEIKSFVAQNRDRIKENIQKLFDSSEYLCGQKIKDHNFTHFYVNKDGWVIIVDKDQKKFITLYKVDLNLGNDFNKVYIEKMVSDIKLKMAELDEIQIKVLEEKEINKKIIEENNCQIRDMKEQIKWLEDSIKTIEQRNHELDSESTVKQRELFNQIENFVGARIFE